MKKWYALVSLGMVFTLQGMDRQLRRSESLSDTFSAESLSAQNEVKIPDEEADINPLSYGAFIQRVRKSVAKDDDRYLTFYDGLMLRVAQRFAERLASAEANSQDDNPIPLGAVMRMVLKSFGSKRSAWDAVRDAVMQKDAKSVEEEEADLEYLTDLKRSIPSENFMRLVQKSVKKVLEFKKEKRVTFSDSKK